MHARMHTCRHPGTFIYMRNFGWDYVNVGEIKKTKIIKMYKIKKGVKQKKGKKACTLISPFENSLKDSTLQHLQRLISLFILSVFISDLLPFLLFMNAAPLFPSHQINDTEYETCHLSSPSPSPPPHPPISLRPPKIRNSPLIWNKWPSSEKPKPSDSEAWFIRGAWSRKLAQLLQKLKLHPHTTPNWRWSLKSTISTQTLRKINK